MRRPHSRRCQFQPRDTEILLYIWRWKVCTTAQIWVRYFPNATKKVAYRRLKLFEDLGLLETVSFKRYGGSGWVLTRLGFGEIHGLIDHLESEFYLSEFPEHDFMAGIFHQGDWLRGMPEGIELLTEQELRSIDSDFFPKWSPVNRHHRPDGFIARTVDGEWKVTAIEMELSMKSSSRYLDSSSYYYHHEEIGKVLWCVSRLANVAAIQDSHAGLDRRFLQRHEFVLVGGFRALGWGATIVSGVSKGQTIRQLLVGEDTTEKPEETRGKFPDLHLFDTLKSYHKSAGCSLSSRDVISDIPPYEQKGREVSQK